MFSNDQIVSKKLPFLFKQKLLNDMKTHSMQFLTGLFFILLLTSSGCTSKSEDTSTSQDTSQDTSTITNTSTSTSEATSESLYLKCWSHAFEEDGQDGVKNYRPCATHTFPAARYRQTFTLKGNGDLEYSILAPNDAHTTEQGKWSYDPQTKKLRVSNSQNVVVKEFEVVEINEDALKVKDGGNRKKKCNR